jgi:hypothetical protein
LAEHVFREPVSSRTNSRAYPKPANSGRKKGARNQRLDHLAKVVAASGDPLITPDQRLRAAIARSLPTPGPTLTPSEAFPAEETFVGPIDRATLKTVEEARADRRQRRQTIGPPDGFLNDLTMVNPPSAYEVPDRDEGRPVWKTGYLVLRGSGDARGLVCVNPSTSGGGFSRWPDEGRLVPGDNLSYSGGLVGVAVLKGRTWPLTLSGAPARR